MSIEIPGGKVIPAGDFFMDFYGKKIVDKLSLNCENIIRLFCLYGDVFLN